MKTIENIFHSGNTVAILTAAIIYCKIESRCGQDSPTNSIHT